MSGTIIWKWQMQQLDGSIEFAAAQSWGHKVYDVTLDHCAVYRHWLARTLSVILLEIVSYIFYTRLKYIKGILI